MNSSFLTIILVSLLSISCLADDTANDFYSTLRLDSPSRNRGQPLYAGFYNDCFNNRIYFVNLNDGISKTKFRFEKIEGKSNHYLITIPEGRNCMKNVLSAQDNCRGNNFPDLHWDLTESGTQNQHFRLVPVEGKVKTFTIESVGRFKCDSRFLSGPASGNNIDFFDGDDLSGRQRWILDGFPNIYKSIDLTEMIVDLSNRKIVSTKTLKGNQRTIINQSPTETAEISYQSCTESTLTEEWSSEKTDAFKSSFEAGVSVSVTAGFDIGFASAEVGVKAEATLGVSSEEKMVISNGKSTEKVESQCILATCKSSPNKKAVCYTKIDQITYEVPWTATEIRTKFDGTTQAVNVEGKLKFSDSTSIYQVVEESEITSIPSFLQSYELEEENYVAKTKTQKLEKILKRLSKIQH